MFYDGGENGPVQGLPKRDGAGQQRRDPGADAEE